MSQVSADGRSIFIVVGMLSECVRCGFEVGGGSEACDATTQQLARDAPAALGTALREFEVQGVDKWIACILKNRWMRGICVCDTVVMLDVAFAWCCLQRERNVGRSSNGEGGQQRERV